MGAWAHPNRTCSGREIRARQVGNIFRERPIIISISCLIVFEKILKLLWRLGLHTPLRGGLTALPQVQVHQSGQIKFAYRPMCDDFFDF